MSQQGRALPVGLIALALGGFGIGLTEFGIVGLLPEVAADLAVTESTAGSLVSVYALSVAVGAIVITASVARVERKRVLLGLVVLFVAGNLISALAGGYGVMLTGRIVAALCHGAFFGVGAVVAADMVAEDRKAGAISLMFAGLTVANVVGIPLGTFVGQQFGWRSTFWIITALGVVTFVGISALVRRTPAPPATSLRREMGVLRHPQVLMSALVSILTFGGLVGAYTYIAFTLTEVTGFASSAVPWILLLFGAGTFVGNLVGGRMADRALDASLVAAIAALIVVLVVFALTAKVAWLALVAMGLLGTVGFATAPGLQLRIMRYASDAPTVASGANIAALNIGNAFGAWLGGVTIAAGLGFVSPLWVGAALATGALVIITIAILTGRRARPTSGAATTVGPEAQAVAGGAATTSG